jgi:hypothetical protein
LFVLLLLLLLLLPTGDKIASCVESFPTLGLDVSLHPITRGVVRIQLTITPEFVWKVRNKEALLNFKTPKP